MQSIVERFGAVAMATVAVTVAGTVATTSAFCYNVDDQPQWQVVYGAQ